jgi:hypothetical protein
MAKRLPQGWESLGANDPTKYKATIPGIIDKDKRLTNIPVVTNRSTGNFDVYEPTVFGDKLIYSYNASNNKVIIKDKDKYNFYFDPSNPQGKKNLEDLNKTVKIRTLEIAEKEVSGGPDSISRKELKELKESEGYKSLSNKKPPNKKDDPQAGGDGSSSGSDPSDSKPAPAASGGEATENDFKQIQDAARGYKGRKGYPDEKNLRYPEKMNTFQDCIQFTVMEYQASQLGLKEDFGNFKLRTEKRTSLATITLPMPSGGISDRNIVDWQSSRIGNLEKAFGEVALQGIIGGVKPAVDSAKKSLEAANQGDGKTLIGAIMAAKLTEQAVGTSGLLSRVFGVEMNPSLELLFDGPALRDFSFSFKMTPRSASEAKIVRNIIRTFKQAMSVKRSNSVLLLKSPHTFMIKYLTSNKEHPYLNRFKECALTNCSVNYTPDGQYMSYDASEIDERSMTAYELSLTFNELEPIFDDDYDDNKDNASGPFENIGY